MWFAVNAKKAHVAMILFLSNRFGAPTDGYPRKINHL
jgi:hypothetical protein